MSASPHVYGIVLTLLLLAFIVRLVRQRRLRAKYSFLWLLVGTAVLAMSIAPGILHFLARSVGVYYPPALLFMCAAMLLLAVAVHFSWELTRLEDRTRVLAEELALANTRTRALERQVKALDAPTVSVDELEELVR